MPAVAIRNPRDAVDRTRVYITVDIECAEERTSRRGSLQPALGYDLRIWGRFANQRRDLGIGLIMDELEGSGLRGTFFTEVFGAGFFGEAGLREICQALRDRGHDVQLHAHPAQRTAQWCSQGLLKPLDDMHGFTLEQQISLLREGMGILERCGVPAPDVLAFRAGHFGASNEIWEAIRVAGMRVSSNLNLCYLGRHCKIRWPRPETALFDTGQGVWELPVSNLREPGGGYRHLQVTALSLQEMIDYLKKARATGIPEVTIVTHSFEYFWVNSIREKRGRLNHINAGRLRGLCRWLRDHSSDFEVETLGDLARRLPLARPASIAQVPAGSRVWRLKRLVEQAVKRVEARGAEAKAKS